MEDTWFSRELPVLRATVELFDDPERHSVNIDTLAEATGFDIETVQRALSRLNQAEPPYLKGAGAWQLGYPVKLLGVTERALRDAGQWPTPENLADRLIAGLEQAAEAETDPAKKTRLRRAAEAVGGVGRDLFVEITAAAVSRQAFGG